MTFATSHSNYLDPDCHDPLEDEAEGVELQAAEAEIEQAEAALPELDLDSLLAESITLKDAKRKAGQGRKLSTDEEVLLTVAQTSLDWSPVAQVALFRNTRCSCGSETRTFIGWYSVLRHRREASARRLSLEAGRRQSTPAFAYNTLEQVETCPACLQWLEEVTFSEVEQWNLSALGRVDFCPETFTSFERTALREAPLPCIVWAFPNGTWLQVVEGVPEPYGATTLEVEGCSTAEEIEEAVLEWLTGPEGD